MNDMYQRLQLVSGIAGFGNPIQEMHIRTQSMSISSDNVDKLFLAKYGDTALVSPTVVREVANASGGVSTQSEGTAYIQDGWGAKRGICKLDFVTESNALQEERLTILGYMYGGIASMEGISGDTYFVPVKMWSIVKQSTADHNGLPVVQSGITNAGTFQLDIPAMYNSQGLSTIRPADIIEASAIHQYNYEQQGDVLDGYTPTLAGKSILRAAGLNISRTDNLSTTKYAEKLLNASMNINHSASNYVDGMTAISEATNLSSVKEMNIYDNPFVKAMRQGLGITSMSGFQGFTFMELMSVFPNINDVLTTRLMDESIYKIHDNRLDSKEMGSSSYHELISVELSNLLSDLMINNKLMYITFSANNDLTAQQAVTNNSGVQIVNGQFLPIMDNDPEAPYNVEMLKEQIISIFYGKYNGDFISNKMIVTVNVEANLFGEVVVDICLNGDYENGRHYVNPAWGDNRYNLILTSAENSSAVIGGFYNNLKNHFNINKQG